MIVSASHDTEERLRRMFPLWSLHAISAYTLFFYVLFALTHLTYPDSSVLFYCMLKLHTI